jgi:hypothetical protein
VFLGKVPIDEVASFWFSTVPDMSRANNATY